MAKASTQEKYVKSAIRFPPDVHAQVQAAAERNGRSLNAEVIDRLRTDRLEAIERDIDEIKSMLRQVLNEVRK
jgi:Arc-like DNA binding domain